MRKIAALYGGSSQHYRTLNEPKYRQYLQDIVYLPELADTPLSSFDVVLVTSRLHRGLMDQARDKLKAYVEEGGTVVAMTPLPDGWLTQLKWEFRPTNFWWWLDKDASSGLVQLKPEHDLFRYISMGDATWHYHGVFWPKANDEVVIATEDGGAVLFTCREGKGSWIITTLDPDFHFGSYFMPAAEKFLDGFLPWLAEGNIR
ncbi:hypothetical protein ACFPVX_08100 [Cohnella faecalis]|uniref:Uncharacterized protein n=1 Tax=Cohnella faecalis TaxID=2315694 RepID=A0A398CNH7_9BACL|nr:hypothetical protein [Cohnella faecalis]RIE04045.1 hypothetical protein D3H35_08820 [Cohnella faecalis]